MFSALLASGKPRRPIPSEGDPDYKSLRDFTNEELIEYLSLNQVTDLRKLSGIMSEILRRMNEKSPLLPKL